ncbi:MAG: dihydropteroate synthase [Paludibacteraceae bacterium]|nr:dihydropteroate synthase [Paludibacteraceae bacterium]
MNSKTMHIGSLELCLKQALVMGILNVTPDSFYAPSRVTKDEVVERAGKMLDDGASILDIGGCSTRPGFVAPSVEEEWDRVAPALDALRSAFPESVLSLDTFRAEIARRALNEFGGLIINDVTGGDMEMYQVVREFKVPYVLTGKRPTSDMSGVEIILDPGIGFLGSTEADFEALRTMKKEELPLLVGVSRKSLIWKTLGCTPDEALAPTQALHMYALMHGADILRVHDVKEAAETIELFLRINH